MCHLTRCEFAILRFCKIAVLDADLRESLFARGGLARCGLAMDKLN